MKTILSPISNNYFFMKYKKLYKAPPKDDDQNIIDFSRADRVDYFFLTSDEFEEAMAVLSIFDEMEAEDEVQ